MMVLHIGSSPMFPTAPEQTDAFAEHICSKVGKDISV